MEENERKVAFDFRQHRNATYWRRVSAVSIFSAPVIAAAYAASIHGHMLESTPIHAVSRAARLVFTEAFVVGLFAAVSPHEPTGSARKVALVCIVTGLLFSLLAAYHRWLQPSASAGEQAIRVCIPSAIFFLWLRLLHGYYWQLQGYSRLHGYDCCGVWEGFRLCAVASHCLRLVGVLLLRSAVSPAVTSYPPGQLPFESAIVCNLLLVLVPAALTPPNRMRLALASGLQTISLSQLHLGHRAPAQPPQLGGAERHPGMVAASASTKDEGSFLRQRFFGVASQSAKSLCSQSHDSLGAELPGLHHLPLGFEIAAPAVAARPQATPNSPEMPLLSPEVVERLERVAFVPVRKLRTSSSTTPSSEQLVQRTAGLQIGSPTSEAGQQAPTASRRSFFGGSPIFGIRPFRPSKLAGRFAALRSGLTPPALRASPPVPDPAPQPGQVPPASAGIL